MGGENYKIELFIFPDGTSVELMVFDRGRGSHAGRQVTATADVLPAQARSVAVLRAAAAGRGP